VQTFLTVGVEDRRMDTIRVPEEHFEGVPDFEYDPQYVTVGDGLRMAYVEAGDADGGETFLCLHGEPTWGFLYRKMIPRLSEVGRVVVPDFPGFGRSDRYADPGAFTFEGCYDALGSFVDALDLDSITLVCQDWGGILGLLLASRRPELFARLVPMNTGLPDGTDGMPPSWHEFREYVENVEDLSIGRIVAGGTIAELSEEVLAAYEAPFPGPEYEAAARAWPGMVPTDPEDPGADAMRAARERLANWEKPAFVLFGDSDPITHDARDLLRDLLPTASEQPDVWVEDAGHFLQEDAGEDVADRIADFVERTP
jgi:haloalkane dehalogenase